jgi:uncharacterized membrane protein YqhA
MDTNKISHIDGRIRGKEIDIEFNEIENNKPKELKLHHVTPLPQKIQVWCIVILSVANILSTIINIATSIGFSHSNSTWTLKPN